MALSNTSGTKLIIKDADNTLTPITMTSGVLSGTIANAVKAATVTVIDTTSATCKVGLFESATGDLAIKTDAGLTYDATTATLVASIFSGALSGNATTSSSCSGNATTSSSCSGNALTATTAVTTTGVTAGANKIYIAVCNLYAALMTSAIGSINLQTGATTGSITEFTYTALFPAGITVVAYSSITGIGQGSGAPAGLSMATYVGIANPPTTRVAISTSSNVWYCNTNNQTNDAAGSLMGNFIFIGIA